MIGWETCHEVSLFLKSPDFSLSVFVGLQQQFILLFIFPECITHKSSDTWEGGALAQLWYSAQFLQTDHHPQMGGGTLI